MSVQTDVVIAHPRDANAILGSTEPTTTWEGFTFKGFDRVQLCTLLSLLTSGSPDTEFERYLSAIESVSTSADGTVVYGVKSEQVTELTVVEALTTDQLVILAIIWANTEEFVGWLDADVAEVLRRLGVCAALASRQGKWLFIRQAE